jgi:hypothetical protein
VTRTTTALLAVNPLPTQDVAGQWKGRMEPGNVSAEIELGLRRTGGTLMFGRVR